MEAIVYLVVAIVAFVAYNTSDDYRKWVDDLPE